jgi:ribosome-associated protein
MTAPTSHSTNETPIQSSKEKALACVRAALEKKAENLKALDVSELSGFTDFFVICNGSSDRQVQAIADSIESAMIAAEQDVYSIEGYSDGRWVLMDLGDVVIHIFLDALRDYYDLESLWADAPVLKIPAEYYGPGATRLN